MEFGKVVKCGVFDSKKKFISLKITPLRTVEVFEFEYLISCDKNARSYINDTENKLLPQMLIVRKPGERCQSRLHFKCYCIHLRLERDNPYYEQLKALPNFFSYINSEIYRNIFESFTKHNVTDPNRLSDEYSLAKLFELIYQLKKDAALNREESNAPKKNPFVLKSIAYMKKHFPEKITLQTLGDLTGYSPNHFQRIFTESAGVSPQKYLENLRLKHAKYLLAKGEKGLAEISYACGFSSQAYFTALFKRETLLTPKEFRNAALSSYPD